VVKRKLLGPAFAGRLSRGQPFEIRALPAGPVVDRREGPYRF
jgi:hypothetical protein